MANPLQIAGAALPASDFAPLHVNRQATGMWPNTNPMRDASTTGYVEANYGGKRDSYSGGANCEISTRLTLIRRPGLSIYNSQIFPAITRFYGWNTFTLTTEAVRLMVDTAATVYDGTGPNTKTAIFTKSAGAGPTYFLGVGNTLYMTNGVDNIQYLSPGGQTYPWGIKDPTVQPNVSIPASAGYGQWAPNSVLQRTGAYGGINLIDPNGNVQYASTFGKTGATPPSSWATAQGSHTADGTVSWQNRGNGQWIANHPYGFGNQVILYVTASDGNTYFYTNQGSGVTGATAPNWLPGLNSVTQDNGYSWLNVGRVFYYTDIGNSTIVGGQPTILDASGGVQQVAQAGKTGTTAPSFNQIRGILTADPSTNGQGAVLWQNIGSVGEVQWGYAYMNSVTKDISNMSPPSFTLSTSDGELVNVTGPGIDPATGTDTIVVFRTAHGGSTFLYAGQLANPGAGNQWQFNDNVLDADLNTEWQAQRSGEGTPLPSGATCMTYHVGRIFAAVVNVVYVSAGPDAIAGGSSGNAGFNTTFTAQSKITRFWNISLGVVVFTLRDAYIIKGSGTDADPLYMTTWLESIPLLNYDAFAVILSSAYMFGGHRMVESLDPGSGITEASFPIAPLASQIDPSKAYLTMHTGGSGETALYLSDGATLWYRMAPTSAPETGANWNPAAIISGGISAVQSVEILPGTMALLVGPSAAGGPIRARDVNTRTDAGTPYPMSVDYNAIVLANPGQLAGLAWMTLKCSAAGTAPKLGVLLDEISGDYEDVPRTRQDPPNLPPSTTYLSDRHSLLQNQKPVWCQVIKYGLQWEAIDSPDELLTSTIFGQTWQEQRSQ